jgi:hypothetical protein
MLLVLRRTVGWLLIVSGVVLVPISFGHYLLGTISTSTFFLRALAGLALVSYGTSIRSGRPFSYWYRVKTMGGGLAAVTGTAFIIFASESTRPDLKGSLTAVGCLALGLGFYMFRQKQRIAYGVLEAGVGVYLAWAKAAGSSGTVIDFAGQPTFLAAVLTASVYLIVRGIDNVMVGWKARQARLQQP